MTLWSYRGVYIHNNTILETGFGETGFGGTGFGETEFGKTGFGKTGFGETGFGETGFGETGFGETGFGETGFVETGFGETGFGETGGHLYNSIVFHLDYRWHYFIFHIFVFVVTGLQMFELTLVKRYQRLVVYPGANI